MATCARGTEAVLAEELGRLGLPDVAPDRGAVTFGGDLRDAYRVCLWSRVASRVLWPLARFDAADPEALYEAVRQVAWEDHLAADRTFAVRCVGNHASGADPRYLALKTKDAVVDRLRDRRGHRPNVDTRRPDVRLHVHLDGGRVTVGVDLSGESLHRRGYRPRGAAAPLKENLAAAILYLAEWPSHAARGEPLVDPLCGSGTFLVEAAWMALDVAPALGRRRFGFEGWLAHDPGAWRELKEEARARRRTPSAVASLLCVGHDADGAALEAARESVRRADVEAAVKLERRALADCAPPAGAPGLVVTNPPYGERLGDAAELVPLYETLGDVLRRRFAGFRAFVLAGNRDLIRHVGLRARRKHVLFNGPIECRLLDYPIADTPARGEEGPRWRTKGPDAPMLDNRLRKNLRRLRKAMRREGTDCYRLYDRDIPEYNVVIDVYGDAAHVQEYQRPRKVDRARAEQHLRDVRLVVPEVLDIAPEAVFLKVRRKQRGGSQYEKRGEERATRIVRESGLRFEVNLSDYLDTGLFLEHRQTRQRIRQLASGKRFLNLFAYTCTATVYAAAGGARATTSVDLSNTYLAWGRRNLRLNELDGPEHTLVRADALAWLDDDHGPFDLIYLAPPTYSRSKAMRGDFDLARDQAKLLGATARHLARGGTLWFGDRLVPQKELKSLLKSM